MRTKKKQMKKNASRSRRAQVREVRARIRSRVPGVAAPVEKAPSASDVGDPSAAAVAEIEASPALKKTYDKLKTLLVKGLVNEASAKYEIGAIVAGVKNAPKTYGTGAVNLLAKAFRHNEDTLYEWASVAEAFAQKEFDKLLRRSSAVGIPLSFSHLIEIAKARRTKRPTLIERCLNESLTVRELRELVRPRAKVQEEGRGDDALGDDEGEGADAAPEPWSMLPTLSSEMVAHAKGVSANVEALAETESSEELRTLLTEALGAQREIQELCTGNIEAIEAHLDRVVGDLDEGEAEEAG